MSFLTKLPFLWVFDSVYFRPLPLSRPRDYDNRNTWIERSSWQALSTFSRAKVFFVFSIVTVTGPTMVKILEYFDMPVPDRLLIYLFGAACYLLVIFLIRLRFPEEILALRTLDKKESSNNVLDYRTKAESFQRRALKVTIAQAEMTSLDAWQLSNEKNDRLVSLVANPTVIGMTDVGVHLVKEVAYATAKARGGKLYKIYGRSKGYDLRLMSISATEKLIEQGRSLVIVSFVDADLHVRIFDASGKKVVDKAESELVAGETLTALKQRLTPLPDEASLSQQDKQEIIDKATSIAGHARSKDRGEIPGDPVFRASSYSPFSFQTLSECEVHSTGEDIELQFDKAPVGVFYRHKPDVDDFVRNLPALLDTKHIRPAIEVLSRNASCARPVDRMLAWVFLGLALLSLATAWFLQILDMSRYVLAGPIT